MTDAERAAAGKSVGYCTRRARERADQRGGAESGPLPGTQATIAGAPICQANRIVEVSVIGGTDRDRLPRRQRLGHARADRCDYGRGEEPNHSNA